MTAFYTSLKAHEIHHLKNLLESAGIRCRLRNEGLSTLAGEVPFTECAMQLVLVDEADRSLANTILLELTARHTAGWKSGAVWNCGGCGERLEGQFTACWNCGREKS
jgi:hypothetical protein